MTETPPDDVLLGIDIGTGSVKLAFVDSKGRILGMEKKAHSIETPREGWVEVPIEDIWNNIIEKIRELVKNAPEAAKRVRGIGISTLCPGLTPLAEDGSALAPSVIYADARSLNETEEIRSRIGEEAIFNVSGNILMPGSTSLTSILWFRNQRPEIHRKTAVYGHINTFIGKKLTGKFGIDYSNASYTGIFETSGGFRWSLELVRRVDLEEEKLPPLLPAWKSLGGLTNQDFITAGLPAGIPVAMGGGDTACSAFAVGVMEHNQVFESAGTSNVITVCSEKPNFDRRFMNRCHVVPGRWLYHGAMSSTGASIRWLLDEVFSLKRESEYERVFSLDKIAPPDAPCPVFLPYMAGERSPVWDPRARGVFFGLGLTTRREHLVRALFESCAYGSRQLLEIVETLTGDRFNRILSIGGWSEIDPLNRIKADITERTVDALDISEAAVLGAALLGGMASGVYATFHDASASIPKTVRKTFIPDSSHAIWYEKRYSIYTSLYPRLRDLFSIQV